MKVGFKGVTIIWACFPDDAKNGRQPGQGSLSVSKFSHDKVLPEQNSK